MRLNYNLDTILSVLLVTIFFISACELTEEINYKEYYYEDKIVMHGYISLNDGIKVCVKKSVPPHQIKAEDKLSDVSVYLLENGEIVDTLISVDDYFFTSNKILYPRIGAFYQVKAVSPKFPVAISTPQKMIMPVELDTAYLVKEELTNYVNLIGSFYNRNKQVGYYIETTKYNDGAKDSSRLARELFSPYGIKDNIPLGQYTFSIFLGTTSEFDSVELVFYTLSNDFVMFLTSIKYYETSKEDLFYEYTYPVFSNIKGGYGIFGSYSSIKYKFKK